MSRWLVWQIVDSAFPTGGFAHSGGLEAAVQLGEIAGGGDGIDAFARHSAWQAGFGGLPLVGAAWDAPGRFAELDAWAEAFLLSVPARRASARQGKAFAAACAQAFGLRVAGGHLPVVLGAALRELGLSRDETQAIHLHATVRGTLAAAVRLGKIGPLESQRIQLGLAPLLDEILAVCGPLGLTDMTQTAPLVDLVGAQQDRLYSRMFQS